MFIDKSKLKEGIWYTDDQGEFISKHDGTLTPPPNAVFTHVLFPFEMREHIYEHDKDGRYGGKDEVCTLGTNLCRSSGDLAVAMVNSGDYDLYEALAVLAQACERCTNVLWNKYLPDEDGYEEFSEEWHKAGTVCDFCKGE